MDRLQLILEALQECDTASWQANVKRDKAIDVVMEMIEQEKKKGRIGYRMADVQEVVKAIKPYAGKNTARIVMAIHEAKFRIIAFVRK